MYISGTSFSALINFNPFVGPGRTFNAEMMWKVLLGRLGTTFGACLSRRRTSVVSCAKWKKSLKRGLLVEQYLVVKVAAQRFMLFGFPIPSIFSFFEGAGPRLDSTIP